mmetsp:Transcript_2891/g.7971  ORF Transcript_2891/g.7971 Transcript_2891/m.7971 type:complete len:159 (-) Transcript_2891:172-648(-)
MSSAPYREMGESDKSGCWGDFGRDFGALVLRVVVSLTLVHHGLQKFHNPEGFSAGVVAKSFPSLPGTPLLWTYAAAGMEIVAPVFLACGLFARLASFGLLITMCFANVFHFMTTGLEGYPLGVPAAGAYAFEPSMLCGAIFFYFMVAGPGKWSLTPKY